MSFHVLLKVEGSRRFILRKVRRPVSFHILKSSPLQVKKLFFLLKKDWNTAYHGQPPRSSFALPSHENTGIPATGYLDAPLQCKLQL